MPFPDPYSVAGATLPVEEHTTLLVIGAGPAGLAAATAAAQAGQAVILVDENPVPAASMAEDVPHFFGGRMTTAARNRTAMLEAFIASDPAIAAAFDAGVDVRLGTLCWGLYANNASVAWLPGPVAGLSDGERSWLVGAERIIVATGRRDVALAFDGWAQPGVMGMEAATLLARLGALDVRRAVVLGTTTEAVIGATSLRANGVEIVAMVEPGAVSLTDPGPLPVLHGHTIRRAEGGREGVTAVVLAHEGRDVRIACDSIITAIGTVPLLELLDSATCRTVYDAARGGHVPVLDECGCTSVPGILAAGDCAGIWAAKSHDAAIAAGEGRRAALNQAGAPPPEPLHDIGAYRLDWVRSAVLGATTDPEICQCEGVTAHEILEVRPPRYLDAAPDRRNRHDLASMLGNGPPSPDQVKRLTRAGMGLCQGRRCRDQVACLLALSSGLALAEIPMATHRAPARPIPLRVAAPASEDAGIAEHWDVWFGMRSQYRSFWDLPETYTVARRHDGAKATE